MRYQLKQTSPEFDVVDGPLSGRKFKHGEVYEEIPEGDKRRFEEISSTTPEVSTTPTPPYQGGELNKGGKTK